MRAAVQAPPAEVNSPNREDRMKLIDLQRKLQEQVFMSCIQKSRIKQLEEKLLQKEALPLPTDQPQEKQENIQEKELNRQLQEQLAINLKNKKRLEELHQVVQHKESLENKVEELQKELDTRSEDQKLRNQQLHEAEVNNDKLIHISKVLKWKVQDLENQVQQKKALEDRVQELENELKEARELNEKQQKEQEEKQALTDSGSDVCFR
ncbi:hypothetical protein WMY93_015402 [Mugilogobius chulae]|uniref:Uncharacterized protein n=1 Tax=Mugilogobius chulae TaxID=88201 RepID=A0AAW0NX39_9GOBI